MIKLHKEGERCMRDLIAHGKVDTGPFSFDSADKDALLGPKGTHIDEFAKHHLGEDDQATEEDGHKRFRYPAAKEGKVYSRALESIEGRAKANGHDEVAESAKGLRALIGEGDEADVPTEANSATKEREVRCLMSGVELRSAPEGSKSPGTVLGYAAVFGSFSEDLGYFREKIATGAFSGCLSQDVRALANHDPSQLLGRNKASTLRMIQDELGLKVEIDLPDTSVGRDTAESIRRGDMDGMSFSFTTDIDQWDYSGDTPIRTLIRVRSLYDVGPVTYPAYTDTSAAMRSLDASRPKPTLPIEADSKRALSQAKARQLLAEALLLRS